MRIDREDARGRQEHGVAVRAALATTFAASEPLTPGWLLTTTGWPSDRAHAFGKHQRDGVHESARRERHDEGDRPRRKIGGVRGQADRDNGNRRERTRREARSVHRGSFTRCGDVWRTRRRERFGEEAHPVAAHDPGDLIRRGAAARELLDDVGETGGVVHPLRPAFVRRHRHLLGRRAFARPARVAPPRAHLPGVARAVVAADRDRVDADAIDDPCDHVAEFLERGRGAALGHVAVGREPDHAAAPGERLDGLGRLLAAGAVDAGAHVLARIRVRDRHRHRGALDRVERRALAAMRKVDEDADLVHLLDRLAAEARRDAGVVLLPVAAADVVLQVVGELHDAHAEVAKRAEEVDVVLDGRRVLEAEHDRGASRPADRLDLLDARRRATRSRLAAITVRHLPSRPASRSRSPRPKRSC